MWKARVVAISKCVPRSCWKLQKTWENTVSVDMHLMGVSPGNIQDHSNGGH